MTTRSVPADTASPSPAHAPAGGMASGCVGCRDARLTPAISMAFQPIVDAGRRRVFAYEALVRGPGGEGAASVLSQVTDANRYGFDQACRVQAIEHAARLRLADDGALLSINFLPNAVYRPEACIRTTYEAARRTGFPLDAIVFEVTEVEQVSNPGHLRRILEAYREMGFRTAIDDFGAGHSGLNLLADFQPDILKLDMALVRGADADRTRRTILRGIVGMAADLGIAVVAEGVETPAEFDALRELGVSLFQGYLFARPGFQCLPAPAFPETVAA